MLALAQCWFTRKHLPARKKHREEDGSWTSHCRHCDRAIVSWEKDRWFLTDGFNVTRLAEQTGTRFLYLFDPADDFIVARFPVNHLQSDAEIEAFREELRVKYGLDQPASDLELHDSAGRG